MNIILSATKIVIIYQYEDFLFAKTFPEFTIIYSHDTSKSPEFSFFTPEISDFIG